MYSSRCIVQLPAISVILKATLTTASSSLAYSSCLTRYHTRYRRTVRHLPYEYRTRRVLLAILLTAGGLYTTLLIDVVVITSDLQLYSAHCTTSWCLYHSSLIRTPSSPAYSSRLTRYRTYWRQPLCHPPHRRRSRCVSLAIVLIMLYYILSVSVTLRAGLTTTPNSPAYSLCHTRYHTRLRRPLRHPPHPRCSRHVSLAIVLITLYFTTSLCLCHSES
jgi:hypothetical protein